LLAVGLCFGAALLGIAIVVGYLRLPVKPAGDVLVYRVVKDEYSPEPTENDWQDLVNKVDARVNFNRYIAYVTRVDRGADSTLEVRLFGKKNSSQSAEVIRLLETRGELQLRVLAHREADQKIVAISDKNLLDNDVFVPITDPAEREFVARWVNVHHASDVFRVLSQDVNVITRQLPSGQQQVLVLLGPSDLTQMHVRSASATRDESGHPALQTNFTSEGSDRMMALTTAHVSTPQQTRYMAIIVDGQLVSAPAIRSKVGGEAILTGIRSKEQVENLAATLSSGPLPVDIVLDNFSQNHPDDSTQKLQPKGTTAE
jgi:preprotein translocase subunit SecD